MHSKSRTLELVYDDGEHSSFSFEFLRVMSPSADVAGHTPEQAVLQVGKRDVVLTGVEPAGLYALKLVFSDGHDTGIYSWDYFERLARTKDSSWQAYLDKLKLAGASRDPDDPANKPFLAKEKKPAAHCGA